jgi:putative membrane protein
MKRMSLVSLVCAAALSAACNSRSNNPDPRVNAVGRETEPSASTTGANAQSDRSAAADNPGTIGTSGVASDQSGPAGATGVQGSGSPSAGANDEQQFTQQAAVAGMAEVELGRLAQQRASNARVKDFARMMVRDHSKANDELKQVAKAQNIQLPTQLDQKHRDLMMRLQQLRGADFDREYMRAMVDGHMEVRDMLSREAGAQPGTSGSSGAAGSQASASNGTASSSATGTSGRKQSGSTAGVGQWASKTLPTVEHHLQEAQQISTQVQNNTSGSSSAAPRSSGSGSPEPGSGNGSNSSGSGTSSSGR